MPATRRSLAGAASLLAVFGSTGPSATAEAEPGSELATFEDYAAQEYEAWPEDAGGELASLSKFLPRCATDHTLIVMALAVMKRDHLQNAAVAAEAPTEDMVKFTEALLDMSERYGQLSQMLHSAHLRVAAAVARHLVLSGEA